MSDKKIYSMLNKEEKRVETIQTLSSYPEEHCRIEYDSKFNPVARNDFDFSQGQNEDLPEDSQLMSPHFNEDVPENSDKLSSYAPSERTKSF